MSLVISIIQFPLFVGVGPDNSVGHYNSSQHTENLIIFNFLKKMTTCFGLVTIHHQDIQYINLQENIYTSKIIKISLAAYNK